MAFSRPTHQQVTQTVGRQSHKFFGNDQSLTSLEVAAREHWRISRFVMHANSKRLIVVIFLSIILCVLSCVGFTQITKLSSEDRAPIKTLDITISADQREKFFAKLRSFAD